MDDDLQGLANLGHADDEARLRGRIDVNARAVRRSARWRFRLRAGFYGGFALFVASAWLGNRTGIDAFYLLAIWLLLVTCVSAVGLFFMGGLAPPIVYFLSSDRQRRMIDN